MTRVLASSLMLVAFHASIRPLPAPLKNELVAHHDWHSGCPVAVSGLRLLTDARGMSSS